MRDDSYCNLLCQKKFNKKDVETFKKAISEEYHHNWIIDNLPAASVIDTEECVASTHTESCGARAHRSRRSRWVQGVAVATASITSGESHSRTIELASLPSHILPWCHPVHLARYITTSYSRGFPVGYMDTNQAQYLYNHVNIIIKYHELGPDENRVVGFYVEPFR